MANVIIKKVEFLYKNQPTRRQIKVTLASGNIVRIVRCYESWEQYGGTEAELWKTMPIAERYNGWLHGEADLTY